MSRSLSKFHLLTALALCLLIQPVSAAPGDPPSDAASTAAATSTTSGLLDQLLAALGIIGTGKPEPADDDLAAFGIIGTGDGGGD